MRPLRGRLREHVDEGMERTKHMRGRGINEWKITKSDPGRVILIDEAGQLFRPNVDPKIKKRIISAVDTMTYQFRKCGYVVVACTQQPNLNAIPIRHGFTSESPIVKAPVGYQQVTKLNWISRPSPSASPALLYHHRRKRVAAPNTCPKCCRSWACPGGE